jgi:hypothetical protein
LLVLPNVSTSSLRIFEAHRHHSCRRVLRLSRKREFSGTFQYFIVERERPKLTLYYLRGVERRKNQQLSTDLFFPYWLLGKDTPDFIGSNHPVAFTPVSHKDEARGDEEQLMQTLLTRYESDLNRAQPGYIWSIEPREEQPILNFVIRGDRAGWSTITPQCGYSCAPAPALTPLLSRRFLSGFVPGPRAC